MWNYKTVKTRQLKKKYWEKSNRRIRKKGSDEKVGVEKEEGGRGGRKEYTQHDADEAQTANSANRVGDACRVGFGPKGG